MTKFEPSKSDIIWASQTFLCKELPDDYEKWDDEKFENFIEDNVWALFENKSPSYVWEKIGDLASSVRIYIEAEKNYEALPKPLEPSTQNQQPSGDN